MEDALELVMTPTRGAAGVRVRLVKRITSIGSAPDADLRFHSLPAHWATVHRDGPAAVMRVLADGASHSLAPGARVEIDGVTVELGAPDGLADAAVDALAARLAGVDGPDDALAAILDGVIAATGADLGAIVLTDAQAGRATPWTVACARDATGAALDGAAELLSDTIVRDVLGTGERVLVTDVGQSPRYARVPSVAVLGLSSVLCLPLRLEGRTLGAIFVGAKSRRAPFGDRAASELRLLTALAVPFLAQLRLRARTTAPQTGADLLVGESPAIDQVRKLVRRVGPTDLSVLVLGASGTGKELVARAIHDASGRASRPLVAINCAAVPATLLDAELFGYKRGAFTGATADRAGLIEAAHGSTLFLDEVGDMPLPMQAALLRVLEQREVRRLGETEPRAVDFRLIAATHRDLVADVAAGRFREDLLFRLQEMRIDVPPLRDRGEDVLLLARAFLRQAEAQLGLLAHGIAADAIDVLLRYPWPGNVRELKAAMRRAAILAEGSTVRADDLQLAAPPAPRPVTPPAGMVAVQRPPTPPLGTQRLAELGDTARTLADARDDYVRRYVAAVLERCGGNREAAARELDIGVRTLYRYLG
jgi:transcriptional regulator with GAF, ATPase, and Fis domain